MELAARASIIYSPGQVFENIVGIDAALFSKNPDFWKLWDKKLWWQLFFQPYRRGIVIERKWWDQLKQGLDDERFPKFKFNVFIQHKRPEFISTSRGSEYKDWNQPYFRYDLDPNQQNNLYRLEQKVSSQGIVVYGCPAFWQFRELWFFVASGSLVDNSNFARPYDLNGHQRYTFVGSGKNGKVFSEHANIEGFSLLERINSMFKQASDFGSNTDFIYSLSNRIAAVVEESDKDLREGYASIMSRIRISEHELAMAFSRILVFAYVSNVSWGIAIQSNSPWNDV